MRRFILFAGILAACVAVAPRPEPSGGAPKTDAPVSQPAPAPQIDPYTAQRSAWRAASCAADTKPTPASDIAIKITALSGTTRERLVKGLPKNVALAGAWILDADNPNFGGLSGLDTIPGGLLAVSDAGAFVAIALEQDTPNGKGTIAYMRGADGNMLSGKTEGDAEGLAYEDGLALVSFERDHRIEAFDLARCGEAARAVRVADLPRTIGTKSLSENEGAEPLWIDGDHAVRFGYEMTVSGAAPLGRVDAEGNTELLTATRAMPGIQKLVGADTVLDQEGRTRTVFLSRGFTPLAGATIELSWGETAAERITLKRPMPVDNFEGVAAETLENGALRLWIISDDNFNDIQQTLLYAFDIPQ